MEKRRLYKEQTEDINKPKVSLEEQFKKLNEFMRVIDQHIKEIENENKRSN